MTTKEALAQLQALSNEKMIAHNKKNGAHSNQFGAKLGDIRNLGNKIKSDHELGLSLWKSGNIDAQLLATLIVKPKQLTVAQLDEMMQGINFSQVADWFSAYILKEHPEKDALRELWLQSDNPWAARAGWSLLAGKITREADGLDLPKILKRIATEMPKAAPQVQWTMNTALAQIGINHPEHRAKAIEIGEKLGIYRDYPVSKGCTSPFAPVWIEEMVKRQEAGK